MRTNFLIPLVIAAGLASAPASAAPRRSSLGRGINMGDVFYPFDDSTSPFDAGNYDEMRRRLKKEQFQEVAAQGFEHIRLNLGRRFLQDPRPPFELRPEGFALLDQAVDLALAAGLGLVLDFHHDPVPKIDEDPAERKAVLDLWRAIARRYKDRPSSVIYEIMNEPRVENDAAWRAFTLDAVRAIRAADPTRTIVVTGGRWGDGADLMRLGDLHLPNLIYTFHFYVPSAFTHQGFEGKSPTGVHYPLVRDEVLAQWRAAKDKGQPEWPFAEFRDSPDKDGLRKSLEPVLKWGKERGLRLYCGEFGAIDKAPAESRARWLGDVTGILDEAGVSWAVWPFYTDVGTFDQHARLDPALVRALPLGKTAPR